MAGLRPRAGTTRSLSMPNTRPHQTRMLRVATYVHDRKAYQELHQHMYEFTSDEQDVDRWQQQIRTLMRGQRHRPSKLLVIVNPFGGRRRAKMLWETFAAPMMRMAGRFFFRKFLSHQQRVVDTLIVTQGSSATFGKPPTSATPRRLCAASTRCKPRSSTASWRWAGTASFTKSSTACWPCALHGTAPPTPTWQAACGWGTCQPAPPTRSPTRCTARGLSPRRPLHRAGDRNPLDIARVDMLRSQTHTFAVSMISYGYLGDLMKVRDSRTWSVCIALRIHGACVHFLCTFPTVGERAAAAPGAAALRGRRCQGALQQPYLQGQGLLLGRRRCRCPRHHVRPCSTIVDDRITTVHSADHAVHRAQGVCMANCMHCNYNAHLDVPAPQGASAERETVKFTKAAKRVSLVRSQTRGCCM